jgi:hypothetical protein
VDVGGARRDESSGESLARVLDQVDLLGDLDDIGAGGATGLTAAVDVGVDALLTGPDDALDALEGVSDLSDAVDDLL